MSAFSDFFAGGLEGVFNGVKGLIEEFHLPPEKAAQFNEKLQELRLDALAKVQDGEAKMLESVNATMRAEAASSSWLQQDWRPIIGLTYGFILINNYVVFPLLGAFFHTQLVTLPPQVDYAMLGILGVTTVSTATEKVASMITGRPRN